MKHRFLLYAAAPLYRKINLYRGAFLKLHFLGGNICADEKDDLFLALLLTAAAPVKRGVDGIEVLAVQVLPGNIQRLAEALIMNDFPLSQKADGVQYIGIVHQPEDVVIGGACLLFRSHILMEIGQNISLAGEGGGSKGRAGSSLSPYAYSMIHKIRLKTAAANFLQRQIPGQLVNNRTHHFQMGQFFCTYIGIQYAFEKISKNGSRLSA